jgi:uncharacterized cysteine cluster protein YcgN (CxxCxxCC family)
VPLGGDQKKSQKTMSLVIPLSERSCGTCTKCCEGWLSSNIRGHRMYPGKPCFFVEIGKGCTDYENRPAMPCKVFNCEWIKNVKLPEEFKPNNIGFIIQKKYLKKSEYYSLVPASQTIVVENIKNISNWFNQNSINFFYINDNEKYFSGDEEFLKKCYNDKEFLKV